MSLLLLVSACFFLHAKTQEKRALLIGINHYSAPAGYKTFSGTGRTVFTDLDGCRNDVEAIWSIITAKFLFPVKNIDTLFDESATRNNILVHLNTLLEISKTGDFAFVYYAGHGSQVYNSLSPEPDRKDESIVPADAWKKNIADIRDKEMAKIFNQFLDKGVRLTVIIDCCHSGSISRGPILGDIKKRFMPGADYDARDASRPVAPETRKEGNFLLISATQDNELAEEQSDEDGVPHGAFTIALIKALNQQSVNASAINLFTAITAILKSNGKRQGPVMAGAIQRQQETLFGFAKGISSSHLSIAVSGKNGSMIELQGGYALGLYKENELTKINSGSSVKIKIDTVLGISKSRAYVIEGSIDSIETGALFEVTNWVSTAAPLLRLFIPRSNFSYDEVSAFALTDKKLKQSGKVKWINDLEKEDPYTSVFADGGKYYINSHGSGKKELKEVSESAIIYAGGMDSTLYFELPPFASLSVAIRNKLNQNKNILIVDNPSDAHYTLYGALTSNEQISYGLRRLQTAAKDSLESMPVQTKKIELSSNQEEVLNAVADSIYQYAARLTKVRAWLQLVSPSSSFPFHIRLVNTRTRKNVTSAVRLGDDITVHLVANESIKTYTGSKKYVYLFGMDKNGKMTLCYPDENEGNVANRFPEYENEKPVHDTPLFSYKVVEPVGTDNFFLIACDEPIPGYPTIFNQEGVRGAYTGTMSMRSLFGFGNEENERRAIKLPSDWSLIKLAVKSRH